MDEIGRQGLLKIFKCNYFFSREVGQWNYQLKLSYFLLFSACWRPISSISRFRASTRNQRGSDKMGLHYWWGPLIFLAKKRHCAHISPNLEGCQSANPNGSPWNVSLWILTKWEPWNLGQFDGWKDAIYEPGGEILTFSLFPRVNCPICFLYSSTDCNLTTKIGIPKHITILFLQVLCRCSFKFQCFAFVLNAPTLGFNEYSDLQLSGYQILWFCTNYSDILYPDSIRVFVWKVSGHK